MSILILGYYNRKNLGDDLFKYVFLQKFANHNLIFINPDDIEKIPDNITAIIVGGGDLINDYFMSKIRKLIAGLSIPIYAIGVGFPYRDLVTPEYVDIFDIIITRTKYAYEILKDRVKIYYEPDLVFLEPPRIIEVKRNRIGVFFANSICTIDSPLINNLVEIVKYLANLKNSKYIVELYPMNTSGSLNEDDNILNNRICQRVNMKNVVQIHKFDIDDIPKAFNRFKFTVCTRYHAHILSLMYGVPFISLHSTVKVTDLLCTYGLSKFGICMKTDNKLRPVSINTCEVTDLIADIRKFPHLPYTDSNKLYWGITNILWNMPVYGEKIANNMYKLAKQYSKESCDPVHIAKCISFAISKTTNTDYMWGLSENLKKNLTDSQIVESIKWILKNSSSTFNDYDNTTPLSARKYNFRYFDGELDRNLHRSGWSYVVDNINILQNSNGILFDTYCDKTFGWEREFLTDIGILPIRQNWVGVFHHTFNNQYSENNLLNIVNQPVFIESLRFCKYIIVMSEYLKIQLCNYVKVPIHVLHHPTEFVDTKWQKADKLLQVGAWLRNTYSIYDLPKIDIPKFALQGKYMENYYPPKNFINDMETLLCTKYNMEKDISRENRYVLNKFIIGMIDNLSTNIENVTIINKCTNSEYDILLQNSIVFLHLVDASACNTIIECIVRNTPIIVNRIPPVVEYLGEDYPLYYKNLYDVPALLDSKIIRSASKYLQKLDTSRLKISTFMQQLQKL